MPTSYNTPIPRSALKPGSIVPMRFNTFERRPPPIWMASKTKDYARFNTAWEQWLKEAYSPSFDPHFQKPLDNFLIYTTLRSTKMRTDMLSDVREMVMQTLWVLSREGNDSKFDDLWMASSVKQRRSWLLAVFQHTQERAEGDAHLFNRVECPEMTLSWADDPSNYFILMDALMFDVTTEDKYRFVPHPAWSRLNDWETQFSTPPSRGVRLFTEEGKLARTAYLALVWGSLVRLVVRTRILLLFFQIELTLSFGLQLGHSWKKPLSGRAKITLATDTPDGDAIPSASRPFMTFGSYGAACSSCGKDAVCQKNHWGAHRPECGKALEDLETAPTAATEKSLLLKAHLHFYEDHPRAVFGGEFDVPGEDGGDAIPFPFNLPPFVRPYFPALNALKALRDRAYDKKDDLDVGLLGYYIELILKHHGSGYEAGEDPYVAYLAELIDKEVSVVQRLMRIARERIEAGEELPGVDKLVVDALKQLKLGTADLSYPYQNFLPTAVPLLTGLLRTPSAFYCFEIPAGFNPDGRTGILHNTFSIPDDTPSRDRVLAYLRDLAYRIILTGGADERDLGRYLPFVWAYTGVGDPDEEGSFASEQTEKITVGDFEVALGLEPGTARRAARRVAEEGGLGADEEEEEMLQTALEHFEEHGAGLLARLTAMTLEKAAKRRKNQKKKKKSKKKRGEAAADEEAEAEADEDAAAAE
ncbi:hypothetical protein JCM8097_006195 [Rhodosporidiobolus ruineniae]